MAEKHATDGVPWDFGRISRVEAELNETGQIKTGLDMAEKALIMRAGDRVPYTNADRDFFARTALININNRSAGESIESILERSVQETLSRFG